MIRKNYSYILWTLMFCFWFQNFRAQENYAVLRKNLNISAKGLSHELCKTNDTLILQSKDRIDYVYSINNAQKREFDRYVFENLLKIPLTTFTKGRHVFVVRQDQKRIVFVVQILDEFKEEALLKIEKGVPANN
ncbi:hypothetical protein [Gelidibacter mesophilus]|uniref:hypothetical protein n=1 Tax=Gelidibacter mesophilus TaxID=169050 RepID=UPI0012F8EADB|nr:hypothetical protein [Gelidibacter mesophilus]